MKRLFLGVLVVLLAATVGTILNTPEVESDVPILYWVTDPNPAREQQIRSFHKWLVANGHTKPGDPTRPICEMRVDTANNDISKKIIQGVSGVAGDVMDLVTASGHQEFFHDMGLLQDLTDDAKRLGFDPSQTWPAIESGILATGDDGKRVQVMFPCNVFIEPLWVNRATFQKYGLEPPPRRWTFEEFERRGKEFVDAANRGKEFRDTFFVAGVNTVLLYRSLGLSRYNETLTRCTLDDPRYVRVLKRKHKWMYVDRLMPSDADRQSFATMAGYGGSTLQLFNRGNIAMFDWGRFALIQLRKFGKLDLAIVEPPNGGFPNTLIKSRAAVIYVGSKHKDLAVLFLAFLASKEYNEQIVDDADALPPNPKYSQTEAFNRPARYPNEWDCHEPIADMARTIAISASFSPFVSPEKAQRIVLKAEQKFINDVFSAKAAAEEAQRRVNAEIDLTLSENPALRPRYEELLERQKRIDARVGALWEVERLKSTGKPVPADLAARAKKIPLHWIENVFYRRYYSHKGWVE